MTEARCCIVVFGDVGGHKLRKANNTTLENGKKKLKKGAVPQNHQKA